MTQEPPLRILIIDDNQAIHNDFRKILEPAETQDLASTRSALLGPSLSSGSSSAEIQTPHYDLQFALQGKEGAQAVERSVFEGKPFAMAFVDIRMPPGWDGVETITQIWKIDPNIQAVICTAYSDYSWEHILSELGLTDNLLILRKPFDTIEVRQLACALTKKWLLQRQIQQQVQGLEQLVSTRTVDLENSVSLLGTTLESINDGILVVNLSQMITNFNKKFIDMWGIPQSIMEKHDNAQIIDYMNSQLVDPDAFVKRIAEINENPHQESFDEIELNNGKVFERYSRPQISHHQIVGRVFSFRDMTERKKMIDDLLHLATHDSLTDLPNRVLLIDRIQQAVVQAQREKSSCVILFCDLDNFKEINDSLGHAIGDECLEEVAKRLKESVRQSDTVARFGGDEFVVILRDLRNPNESIEIVQKVLKQLNKPYTLGGKLLTMTASIGLSAYPTDATDAEVLLKHADIALYGMKKAGKNGFQFYTDNMNLFVTARLELQNELHLALMNREFLVYYQPVLDIRTGIITGVEALLRWQHPKLGLIGPANFIELAEDTGLIVPLGEWVLETACRQCKIWQDQGMKNLRVSVNLSGRQFKQKSIEATIDRILAATHLSPESLELELTESVLIDDADTNIALMSRLKEKGIHLVVDDFGTGYSSLSYLRRFPVDKLKIDKSFVFELSEGSNDAIVQAIIAMARNLKLQVLAEGVETVTQMNYLKQHNCFQAQGYHFSHPISAQECTALFVNQKHISHTQADRT